jgi:hypothetical protein
MPTLLSEVCCWGQSGKHLLAASISLFDPLQKWGRGERYPLPSIGSNMNVINISAKKSELDLAR